MLAISTEEKLLAAIRRKQVDVPVADLYAGFSAPPVGFNVCHAIVWAGGVIRYYRTIAGARRRLCDPTLRGKAESLIRYRRVQKRRGKRGKRQHWQSEWKAEYFYEESEWCGSIT